MTNRNAAPPKSDALRASEARARAIDAHRGRSRGVGAEEAPGGPRSEVARLLSVNRDLEAENAELKRKLQDALEQLGQSGVKPAAGGRASGGGTSGA